MEPLEAREVGVTGGASGLVGRGGMMPNVLGGDVVGEMGVGLGHHVDLSITGSRVAASGPTGGVTAGIWLVDREKLAVGPTVGVAGAYVKSAYHHTQDVVDENGDPVLDANGEPVTENVRTPYAYATIAPSVGVRMRWRPTPFLGFPLSLRGSYSSVIPIQNAPDPHMGWMELTTGVALSPTEHVTIGIAGGPMVAIAHGSALPMGVVSASVTGRFGIP